MTESQNKKRGSALAWALGLLLEPRWGAAFDKVALGVALGLLLSTTFGVVKYRK